MVYSCRAWQKDLLYKRGAIFGFGPSANDSTGNVLKISEVEGNKRRKLNQTSVHNLNEERSVGFIGYEIQIRGKKDLESASKKMIINKSSDPSKLKDFVMPARRIKDIKIKWTERIREHQAKGFSEKETANLKTDAQKYSILEQLKKESMPGPFTKPEDIKDYLVCELDDAAKNKRLYMEVKCARVTSMSLKPTAAVFRLMRHHRKRETMEYADNLSSYLDSARSCRTITLADFDNALHALCGKESAKTDTSLVDSAAEEDYKIGENVAVFWMDETVQWFLGVVDSNVGANGNILISYLTRSDSTG